MIIAKITTLSENHVSAKAKQYNKAAECKSMEKLLVCFKEDCHTSEQAKAAKINTTVFIQKATKPVTRLQP